MASSSGMNAWRFALVGAVLLLVSFFQVELWSEAIVKKEVSLRTDITSDGVDVGSSMIEQRQQQNLTTIDESSSVRQCEVECKVTKETLSPISQHADLDYDSGSADVIFLLGYPYTGTSAMHFLLSTSGNVSTLTGSGDLDADEEGWSLEGMKTRYDGKQRWDGVLEFVNWTQLAQFYGEQWARTDEGGKRPLKVENSPPEIQAPKALKETFEPIYGKVKFILLVRGDCTYSGGRPFGNRFPGYQKVVREYPRDTFVLRYEDLCLSWDEVYRELVRWEPLLSDMNSSAIPTHRNKSTGGKRQLHAHDAVSIQHYCKSKALPKWKDGLKPRDSTKTNRTLLHMLAEYGYDKTNTCTD